MKVYGVLMWVQDCPPAPNGSRQARCIVAAKSLTEAARIFDCPVHFLRTYGCPTGNDGEIKQAMTAPGVAFWTEDRGEPMWRRL